MSGRALWLAIWPTCQPAKGVAPRTSDNPAAWAARPSHFQLATYHVSCSENSQHAQARIYLEERISSTNTAAHAVRTTHVEQASISGPAYMRLSHNVVPAELR